MASDNEASCVSDPNFAVICSFLECFGKSCGITYPDIASLQEMLEDVHEVKQPLIDLHIKLLRKARKTVTPEKWERSLVKFCHTYSNQDGWELERFGYKKARIAVKLRLLKILLESQFDLNPRFKLEVNKLAAEKLRVEPLGRDKTGLSYWFQLDEECNIRVYREDLDEENWELVASDREGVVNLINSLSEGEAALIPENEDSNSLEISEKPIIDTGQVEESSSPKEDTQLENNVVNGAKPEIEVAKIPNPKIPNKDEEVDKVLDNNANGEEDGEDDDEDDEEEEEEEEDDDEEVSNEESSKQNSDEEEDDEEEDDDEDDDGEDDDSQDASENVLEARQIVTSSKIIDNQVPPVVLKAKIHVAQKPAPWKAPDEITMIKITKSTAARPNPVEITPVKAIGTSVITTSPLKLVNIQDLQQPLEERASREEKYSSKPILPFQTTDSGMSLGKFSVKPIDKLAANLSRIQSEKLEKPGAAKLLEKIAENLARSSGAHGALANGDDDKLQQEFAARNLAEKSSNSGATSRSQRGMDLSTSPRGWENPNDHSRPMDYSGIDLSSRKIKKPSDLLASAYRTQEFQHREMDLSTRKIGKPDVANLAYDSRTVILRNHATMDLSKKQMYPGYEVASGAAAYHNSARIPGKEEHRLPNYTILPDPSKIASMRMSGGPLKRPLEIVEDPQQEIIKRMRVEGLTLRNPMDKRAGPMVGALRREEVVGPAIEEPVMMVQGEGSGSDCDAVNPDFGEAIEEPVIFFYGAGAGRECDTGNPGDDTSSDNKESNESKKEGCSDVTTTISPNKILPGDRTDDNEASTAAVVTKSPLKINTNFSQANDTATTDNCQSTIVSSVSPKSKFKPTLGIQVIAKSSGATPKKSSRWDVGRPEDKNEECDSSIISTEGEHISTADESISANEYQSTETNRLNPEDAQVVERKSESDDITSTSNQTFTQNKIDECSSSVGPSDNVEKIQDALECQPDSSVVTDTTSGIKGEGLQPTASEAAHCDSSVATSSSIDPSQTVESTIKGDTDAENINPSKEELDDDDEDDDDDDDDDDDTSPRFFFGPNCVSYNSKAEEALANQAATTSVNQESIENSEVAKNNNNFVKIPDNFNSESSDASNPGNIETRLKNIDISEEKIDNASKSEGPVQSSTSLRAKDETDFVPAPEPMDIATPEPFNDEKDSETITTPIDVPECPESSESELPLQSQSDFGKDVDPQPTEVVKSNPESSAPEVPPEIMESTTEHTAKEKSEEISEIEGSTNVNAAETCKEVESEEKNKIQDSETPNDELSMAFSPAEESKDDDVHEISDSCDMLPATISDETQSCTLPEITEDNSQNLESNEEKQEERKQLEFTSDADEKTKQSCESESEDTIAKTIENRNDKETNELCSDDAQDGFAKSSKDSEEAKDTVQPSYSDIAQPEKSDKLRGEKLESVDLPEDSTGDSAPPSLTSLIVNPSGDESSTSDRETIEPSSIPTSVGPFVDEEEIPSERVSPAQIVDLNISKSPERITIESEKASSSSRLLDTLDPYTDDLSENQSSADQDSNEAMVIDDRTSDSNESAKDANPTEDKSLNFKDKVSPLAMPIEKTELDVERRVCERTDSVPRESTPQVEVSIEKNEETEASSNKNEGQALPDSKIDQVTDSKICEDEKNKVPEAVETSEKDEKELPATSESKDTTVDPVNVLEKPDVSAQSSLVPNYECSDEDDANDDVVEAKTVEVEELQKTPVVNEPVVLNEDKVERLPEIIASKSLEVSETKTVVESKDACEIESKLNEEEPPEASCENDKDFSDFEDEENDDSTEKLHIDLGESKKNDEATDVIEADETLKTLAESNKHEKQNLENQSAEVANEISEESRHLSDDVVSRSSEKVLEVSEKAKETAEEAIVAIDSTISNQIPSAIDLQLKETESMTKGLEIAEKETLSDSQGTLKSNEFVDETAVKEFPEHKGDVESSIGETVFCKDVENIVPKIDISSKVIEADLPKDDSKIETVVDDNVREETHEKPESLSNIQAREGKHEKPEALSKIQDREDAHEKPESLSKIQDRDEPCEKPESSSKRQDRDEPREKPESLSKIQDRENTREKPESLGKMQGRDEPREKPESLSKIQGRDELREKPELLSKRQDRDEPHENPESLSKIQGRDEPREKPESLSKIQGWDELQEKPESLSKIQDRDELQEKPESLSKIQSRDEPREKPESLSKIQGRDEPREKPESLSKIQGWDELQEKPESLSKIQDRDELQEKPESLGKIQQRKETREKCESLSKIQQRKETRQKSESLSKVQDREESHEKFESLSKKQDQGDTKTVGVEKVSRISEVSSEIVENTSQPKEPEKINPTKAKPIAEIPVKSKEQVENAESSANLETNLLPNTEANVSTEKPKKSLSPEREKIEAVALKNESKKEASKRLHGVLDAEDFPPTKSKPPNVDFAKDDNKTDIEKKTRAINDEKNVVASAESPAQVVTAFASLVSSGPTNPSSTLQSNIENLEKTKNHDVVEVISKYVKSSTPVEATIEEKPSEIQSVDIKYVDLESDDSMGIGNDSMFDTTVDDVDPLACTEEELNKPPDLPIASDPKVGIRVKPVKDLFYEGWKIDSPEPPPPPQPPQPPVRATASRKRRNSAHESNTDDFTAKQEAADDGETGGKRMKLRGKRTPDMKLRKSVEQSRTKSVSSEDDAAKVEASDEVVVINEIGVKAAAMAKARSERKPRGRPRGKRRRGNRMGGRLSRPIPAESAPPVEEIPVEVVVPVKPAKPPTPPPADVGQSDVKKKRKKRKMVLGLEIGIDIQVPESQTAGGRDEIPVRQSRRIAQLKIKEEADKRRIEEETIDDIKGGKKDRDGSDKKKRRKQKPDSEEEPEVVVKEIEREVKAKKKRKKKKSSKFNEANPWQSSSGSSTEEEHQEDEDEDDIESEGSLLFKSDHEFSPESDLEKDDESEPLRRARTAQKAQSDVEEAEDEYACQKCGKADHPEWILLCDTCDKGWHCSCLRPALMLIPEGDWFCPPCQHTVLVNKLRDSLKTFDQNSKKHENEVLRKKRLAYVGISLDNVLHKSEGRANDQSSRGSSRSDSSSSSSESSSSTSSSEESEPVYQLRERRCANTYKFNEYDDMINAAIQAEVDHVRGAGNQGRGKDIATIVNAEKEEAEAEALKNRQLGDDEDDETKKSDKDSDEDYKVEKEDADEEEEGRNRKITVRKGLSRKKHRKLNSLDISSEDDPESDEDFKGSSSDDEEDFDDQIDSSDDSYTQSRRRGRKGEARPVRRSTRAARKTRYDEDFINDDSDDSDRPKRKKSRSVWDGSDSEDSDNSWRQKKKRSRTAPASRFRAKSRTKTTKKKKRKRIIEPDNASDNEEAEAEAEAVAVAEDELETEPKVEAEADADADAEVKAEAEVEAKVEAEVAVTVEAAIEPEAETNKEESAETAEVIATPQEDPIIESENVAVGGNHEAEEQKQDNNIETPIEDEDERPKKKKKESTPKQKKGPGIRRKIVYGGLNDEGPRQEEETLARRTRGRKINYQDIMGSDSEEELKKVLRKTEESEDEFMVHEGEDPNEEAEKDSDSGDIYSPKKEMPKGKAKSPKAKKPKKSKSPGGRKSLTDNGTPKERKKPGPKPGSKNRPRQPSLTLSPIGKPKDSDSLTRGIDMEGSTMSATGSVIGEVPEGSLTGLTPEDINALDDEDLEQMMMEDEEYGRRQLELAAIEIARKKQEEREAKKLEKARLKALEILAAEQQQQQQLQQRDPNAPEGTDGELPKKKKRGRRSKAEILAEQMRRDGVSSLLPGSMLPTMVPDSAAAAVSAAAATIVSPNVTPTPTLPTVVQAIETERSPETQMPLMAVPDGQLFSPDGSPIKPKRRGRGKGKKTLALEAARAAEAAAKAAGDIGAIGAIGITGTDSNPEVKTDDIPNVLPTPGSSTSGSAPPTPPASVVTSQGLPPTLSPNQQQQQQQQPQSSVYPALPPSQQSSVITRMLQSQPVSSAPQSFTAAAAAMGHKYFGGPNAAGQMMAGPRATSYEMPPRGRIPSPYRQPGPSPMPPHFAAVRSGTPPMRMRVPGAQLYHTPHHPMDPSPSGGGPISINSRDRSSPLGPGPGPGSGAGPAMIPPAAGSPLAKGGPTPPPPPYVRGGPALARFPDNPQMGPRHQLPPFTTPASANHNMQQPSPPPNRPPGNFSPYHPPPPPNYHYGAYPPPPPMTTADDAAAYQGSPYSAEHFSSPAESQPQIQQPQPPPQPQPGPPQSHPNEPPGPGNKQYDEEGTGEFGGLVSYFSSQREDDLDS